MVKIRRARPAKCACTPERGNKSTSSPENSRHPILRLPYQCSFSDPGPDRGLLDIFPARFTQRIMGLIFKEVALKSDWKVADGSNSGCKFMLDGKWKWLESNINTEYIDVNQSSCSLGRVLPRLTEDLKLKCGLRWQKDYRLFSSGFIYRFQPWESLTFKCGIIHPAAGCAAGLCSGVF